MWDVLDTFVAQIQDNYTPYLIITGGAAGVDSYVKSWARLKGHEHVEWSPGWGQLGVAAGPVRNVHMVDILQPNYCIVFPGGDGTKHCSTYAKHAGIKIIPFDKV